MPRPYGYVATTSIPVASVGRPCNHDHGVGRRRRRDVVVATARMISITGQTTTTRPIIGATSPVEPHPCDPSPVRPIDGTEPTRSIDGATPSAKPHQREGEACLAPTIGFPNSVAPSANASGNPVSPKNEELPRGRRPAGVPNDVNPSSDAWMRDADEEIRPLRLHNLGGAPAWVPTRRRPCPGRRAVRIASMRPQTGIRVCGRWP